MKHYGAAIQVTGFGDLEKETFLENVKCNCQASKIKFHEWDKLIIVEISAQEFANLIEFLTKFGVDYEIHIFEKY